MNTIYSPMRPDDPKAVMAHKDRYFGGKSLIILGGYSAKNWHELRDELNPDVVIGANAVCKQIENLDYWLLAENMTRAYKYANEKGDKRQRQLLEMISHKHNAGICMISHRSWWLLDAMGIESSKYIKIRRRGYDLNEFPDNFTLREYGEGLLSGWLLKHREAGAAVRVGTVALQCLHLAGILGCSEVHTIGFDLLFKSKNRHHWYKHPKYQVDAFRNEHMFIERNYGRKTINTQWFWLETAQYLKGIEPIFKNDDLLWRDHSNGLLKYEELWCAI